MIEIQDPDPDRYRYSDKALKDRQIVVMVKAYWADDWPDARKGAVGGVTGMFGRNTIPIGMTSSPRCERPR